MAVVCRILRAIKGPNGFLSPKFERSLCNEVSSSSSNPLIKKLLQSPNSKIKATLDSADIPALHNSKFSWDAFVTNLRSFSPQKAQLVLEWRLEKLVKEKETCIDQYSELITSCGKAQNLPLAIRVFISMEAHGIKPNPCIFNSLIDASLCSGNVVTALSLFEIMVSSTDYKPNAKTYDTFISRLSSLQNVEAVHKWYSAKIGAGFPSNVKTYEYVISGCIKLGDFEGADRYFEEMTSSGILPSLHVLENMLKGLCQLKKLSQAKQFLNSLLEDGWKISENMGEKLVKLYNEIGDVNELEDMLELLTKFDQSSTVLLQVHCGIIRMYAMRDKLDEVEYSVGRMGKQGLSFKFANDVEKVICSYFRCEAYDRLELFLDHVKGSYSLTRSTYDILVAGYRRAGLSEKLDSVIEEMKLAGIS